MPATLSVTVSVHVPLASSPQKLLAEVSKTMPPPVPLAGWDASTALVPSGEVSVTVRSLTFGWVMLRSITIFSTSSEEPNVIWLCTLPPSVIVRLSPWLALSVDMLA